MNYKMFRFFDPKKEINFAFFFSPCLILAFIVPIVAIISILIFGLNPGIDFSGGTEMQVRFQKEVSVDEIKNTLRDIGYTKSQVQSFGSRDSNEMLIRIMRTDFFFDKDIEHIKQELLKEFETVKIEKQNNDQNRLLVTLKIPTEIVNLKEQKIKDQQKKMINILSKQSKLVSGKLSQEILNISTDIQDNMVKYNILFAKISDNIINSLLINFGKTEIRRMDFVDSHISSQLKTDSIMAVIYTIIAVFVYISIRFNLFFAPGVIVCLIQDVFGAFLIFTLFRYEFDLPSIAALLTIVGVSINNTIVVYDRIREKLFSSKSNNVAISDYDEIVKSVNIAVNDTLSRTINTTLTVLFSSVSLWIFAGSAVRSFAAVLTVGIILGAFSSIFAAPAAFLFMIRNFKDSKYCNNRNERYSKEEKMQGIV